VDSSSNSVDTEPTTTVAVVSWNTRTLLDRCLRSLEPSASAGIADVWVVDNGSADGSTELVREHHPWVHLIASDQNLGYGRAINAVAARTRSTWLAVSNADVALRNGALNRLIAAGEADPGAGIVAPRLLLPDGTTQHSVWAFPTVAAAALQSFAVYRLVPGLGDRLALRGYWDAERARRVPWAVGAFLLVRREAWEEIGGFDPHQWMSAEDLDFGWRMHVAGWATRYEPRAVVDHHESAATGQVWGDEVHLHWQRCFYAWMLRRRGRVRTVCVGLINFAGSGLRWLVVAARARRRHDRTGAEGRRGLARWTLGHAYALAPRRTLARYR
jgi:GT2 family glycosyltransferase